MKYQFPDGRIIEPFTPFMHGNLQYPPNWTQLATKAELDEIGLTEYVDPPSIPVRLVPSFVSRFQALAALLQAGLLADVEAYMALPETDPFIVLAWKEAQEFRRESPIVSGLAQVLSLSETQLDDLFCFAGTITG